MTVFVDRAILNLPIGLVTFSIKDAIYAENLGQALSAVIVEAVLAATGDCVMPNVLSR